MMLGSRVKVVRLGSAEREAVSAVGLLVFGFCARGLETQIPDTVLTSLRSQEADDLAASVGFVVAGGASPFVGRQIGDIDILDLTPFSSSEPNCSSPDLLI